MTIEASNTAIVRAICDALSARDIDGVMGQLAEDVQWTTVGHPERFAFGGTKDKQASREMVGGFLGSLNTFQMTVHSYTAQDDRVAVHASSSGEGPGGAKYQNVYLMLFSVRDGKVTNILEHFDQTAVLAYVDQLQ